MSNALLEVQDFKRLVQDKEEHEGKLVRKGVATRTKAIDPTNRTVDFIISTKAIDRDGDTIDPAGWELGEFLRNPVVLFAHDSMALPIGKAVKVSPSTDALRASAKFTTEDLNPMGDTVFRMIQHGFLSATSVGFAPIEFDISDDESRNSGFFPGFDFKRQTLLEFSVVPVPSNPEALIEARAKGINTVPLMQWAEKILDGEDHGGIVIPKSQLELIHKLADASAAVMHHVKTNPYEDEDKGGDMSETKEDDELKNTVPEDEDEDENEDEKSPDSEKTPEDGDANGQNLEDAVDDAEDGKSAETALVEKISELLDAHEARIKSLVENGIAVTVNVADKNSGDQEKTKDVEEDEPLTLGGITLSKDEAEFIHDNLDFLKNAVAEEVSKGFATHTGRIV